MYKTTIITFLTSLTLAGSLFAQPFARSTPASRLVSAESAGEGKYYFRIYAPEAKQVTISGDFMPWGAKMDFSRDTSGIWTGLSPVMEKAEKLVKENAEQFNKNVKLLNLIL